LESNDSAAGVRGEATESLVELHVGDRMRGLELDVDSEPLGKPSWDKDVYMLPRDSSRRRCRHGSDMSELAAADDTEERAESTSDEMEVRDPRGSSGGPFSREPDAAAAAAADRSSPSCGSPGSSLSRDVCETLRGVQNGVCVGGIGNLKSVSEMSETEFGMVGDVLLAAAATSR
jgi:hypothetical protein